MRFASLFSRRARKASGRTTFRPRFELLEAREVPVVTANFINGNLALLGTDASENLSISSLSSPFSGIIVVTGNGTTIKNNGESDEKGLGSRLFIGVKSLNLDMKDGVDVVGLGQGNFTEVTFDGGKGNDQFEIGTAPSDHVIGRLTFRGGEGNDTLSVHNGKNQIGLALAYGNQGDNAVVMGVEGTDRTTLGSLSIFNGDGFDSFSAGGYGFTVMGQLSINNGPGSGSSTVIAAEQINSIGRSLLITNGNGADVARFGKPGGGVVDFHVVKIENGAGDSETHFAANTNSVTGDLSVKTNGNTAFTAEGAYFTDTGKVNLVTSGAFHHGTAKFMSSQTTSVGTDLIVTDADLSVTGDRFVVGGNLGVGGLIAGAVNIDNGTTTIGGRATFGNVDVTLSSAYATTIRGDLQMLFRGLTLVEGEINLNSATLSTVENVVNNARTNVTGGLTINSYGSDVDNNGTLQVFGNLTIKDAMNVYLDGGGVSVGGNLDVKTHPDVNTFLPASRVWTQWLAVTGTTSINTFGGNDYVAINDSNFVGKVSVNMGKGDDLVEIERALTNGGPSVFVAGLDVDMGAGNDTAFFGPQSAGTSDQIGSYGVVNYKDEGKGKTTLNYVKDNNIIPLFLIDGKPA